MWRERGKQFMFVGKNKWESIRLLYSRQDTASFRPGQPHSRPTKRNLLEGDNVLIVETRLTTNHYYTIALGTNIADSLSIAIALKKNTFNNC